MTRWVFCCCCWYYIIIIIILLCVKVFTEKMKEGDFLRVDEPKFRSGVEGRCCYN